MSSPTYPTSSLQAYKRVLHCDTRLEPPVTLVRNGPPRDASFHVITKEEGSGGINNTTNQTALVQNITNTTTSPDDGATTTADVTGSIAAYPCSCSAVPDTYCPLGAELCKVTYVQSMPSYHTDHVSSNTNWSWTEPSSIYPYYINNGTAAITQVECLNPLQGQDADSGAWVRHVFYCSMFGFFLLLPACLFCTKGERALQYARRLLLCWTATQYEKALVQELHRLERLERARQDLQQQLQQRQQQHQQFRHRGQVHLSHGSSARRHARLQHYTNRNNNINDRQHHDSQHITPSIGLNRRVYVLKTRRYGHPPRRRRGLLPIKDHETTSTSLTTPITTASAVLEYCGSSQPTTTAAVSATITPAHGGLTNMLEPYWTTTNAAAAAAATMIAEHAEVEEAPDGPLTICATTECTDPCHDEDMITSSNTNDDCDADRCAICLVRFVAGDRIGDLPCLHAFHVPCIKSWIAYQNHCPLCMAPHLAAVTSSSSSLQPNQTLISD